jgi:protein O-GlcNAc transferase
MNGPAGDLLARALAHHRAGRLAAADVIYQHILAVDPGHADALRLAALVAHETGDQARAFTLVNRAVDQRPDADAYYARGVVRRERDPDGAAVDFRQAISSNPQHSQALAQLGLLMLAREAWDDAAAVLERAVTTDATAAPVFVNLAIARYRQRRIDDAIACYERALALDPSLDIAANNLATILEEIGRAEEAVGIWRRIERRLGDPILAGNLITALNLVPGDLEELERTARGWAERFAEPLPRLPARPAADPERRLRIGYVGGDGLRRHTLAMTYLPLIEAHDRSSFDIVAYSDLAPEHGDDVTARIAAAVSLWRPVRGLSDEALAHQIRADEIDILVDGIGHAAGSRLLAAARRPAPIQIHFPPMTTTGMSAIDYVIGDEHLLPDGTDRFFSEELWRLDCGFLYDPLVNVPAPAEPPALRNGFITFGSFNRIAKIGPAAIGAWSRVLDAVPRSRLIIKSSAGLVPRAIADYQAAFADAGIPGQRLEFRGRTADHFEHLRHFNDIDIALDTLPFCGVLTTCAASMMGVPVVTWAGTRILERYGATILHAIGAADGVAHDLGEYVAKAVALANNPEELRRRRATLPARMAASPLCDGRAFARALESAYRAMWRRACSRATASPH